MRQLNRSWERGLSTSMCQKCASTGRAAVAVDDGPLPVPATLQDCELVSLVEMFADDDLVRSVFIEIDRVEESQRLGAVLVHTLAEIPDVLHTVAAGIVTKRDQKKTVGIVRFLAPRFEPTDEVAPPVVIQIIGNEVAALHVREQRIRNTSGLELALGKAPYRFLLP